MAALTNADYRELRAGLYHAGDGKEELKALAALPNETQIKAAFQAIEDAMVAAAPGIKADVDAALGATTSATLFKKILRQWFRWRDRQGG